MLNYTLMCVKLHININYFCIDYIVGRVIGGMLGKGFITVSFNGIYIWSGELFPTVVR